jgi:hypothetical protein
MKYEVSIGDFTTYVEAGNSYQAGLRALDEHIEKRCTVPRCPFVIQNLETNEEEVVPFGVLLNIRVLANQNLTFEEIHENEENETLG